MSNMIIDPNSELGKELGLTPESFSNHYMCPKCGHVGNTAKCPRCGEECNYIIY